MWGPHSIAFTVGVPLRLYQPDLPYESVTEAGKPAPQVGKGLAWFGPHLLNARYYDSEYDGALL